MKYFIILSLVLVGFGCASGQKSYCDIVDQETQASQQIIEDEDKSTNKSNQ